MAGRLVPVPLGGVEVMVETAAVAGSEHTSKLGDAANRVVDAFAEAEAVIGAVSDRVATIVGNVAERVSRPASMEVSFGLKFTAQGSVFVASASGEASLLVKVVYEADGQAQ
jgi:hypothetical protein